MTEWLGADMYMEACLPLPGTVAEQGNHHTQGHGAKIPKPKTSGSHVTSLSELSVTVDQAGQLPSCFSELDGSHIAGPLLH